MSYAAQTEVSAAKSQAEIQEMLTRAGARQFGLMMDPDKACIMFALGDRSVRFVLPLPNRNDARFRQFKRGYSTHNRTPEAAHKEWEQACRSRWRALKLCIKAKLEAVECGITTFDEEFLAHIVMRDGKTVGQLAIPQLTSGGPLMLTA